MSSPVICKCGSVAVFKEFQTFSYHYCSACKIEVGGSAPLSGHSASNATITNAESSKSHGSGSHSPIDQRTHDVAMGGSHGCFDDGAIPDLPKGSKAVSEDDDDDGCYMF